MRTCGEPHVAVCLCKGEKDNENLISRHCHISSLMLTYYFIIMSHTPGYTTVRPCMCVRDLDRYGEMKILLKFVLESLLGLYLLFVFLKHFPWLKTIQHIK